MKELIIDNGLSAIRLARIEDGALAELHFEDRENESHSGNIYIARVKSVLPSRFVFLDIGIGRDAFLFLDDAKERTLLNSIKPGSHILVQVAKDETKTKGPLVTARLTFTSKYFVLMSGAGNSGVSQKISSSAEKKRLKAIAAEHLPTAYGVIMRTEAANVPDDVLQRNLRELIEKSKTVVEQGRFAKPPRLIYREENALVKSVDKMLTRDIDKIIINNMEDALYAYLDTVYGGVSPALTVYNSETPIFEHYAIEGRIKEAFNKKVWLKSGGYIIIERTEACIAIDVNSGKFIHTRRARMISKTNLEAAREIARQIRLRNLSGLIMIDFINPKDAAETSELAKYLKDALKADRVPVKVEYVTNMGVFLLIRKYAGPYIEDFHKNFKEET